MGRCVLVLLGLLALRAASAVPVAASIDAVPAACLQSQTGPQTESCLAVIFGRILSLEQKTAEQQEMLTVQKQTIGRLGREKKALEDRVSRLQRDSNRDENPFMAPSTVLGAQIPASSGFVETSRLDTCPSACQDQIDNNLKPDIQTNFNDITRLKADINGDNGIKDQISFIKADILQEYNEIVDLKIWLAGNVSALQKTIDQHQSTNTRSFSDLQAKSATNKAKSEANANTIAKHQATLTTNTNNIASNKRNLEAYQKATSCLSCQYDAAIIRNSAGTFLVMQSDGNVCVRKKGGEGCWCATDLGKGVCK